MEPATFKPAQKTVQATASQVIVVSERAAQEIKTALAAQTETFQGIRVAVSMGGGCCGGTQYALGFADKTEADDVVVEAHGVKFFVDPMSAEKVKGSTLDFVETPMGSGFQVRNPNEAQGGHGHGSEEGHGHGGGGCGCGGHGGRESGGGCGSGGCGC